MYRAFLIGGPLDGLSMTFDKPVGRREIVTRIEKPNDSMPFPLGQRQFAHTHPYVLADIVDLPKDALVYVADGYEPSEEDVDLAREVLGRNDANPEGEGQSNS